MAKKPKLGQNFLIDEAACLLIATSLGDTSDRTIVEIGPGHGAITALLAPRCARLHCIEFDPALARELTFHFRNDKHVSIHHADILETNLAQLEIQNSKHIAEQNSQTSERYTSSLNAHADQAAARTLDVVGNLPYYITSDILLHLYAAARTGILRRAVLMMQREVAERIAAPPGTSDYGALSAFTQMHAQMTNLFTLPPTAFSPPPDVYSTVLRLDFAPRFAELRVDPEGFNKFLRSTFAQKRKTLSNNLRTAGYSTEQLTAAWPQIIPPQARAESVTLEQMTELYRALTTKLPS